MSALAPTPVRCPDHLDVDGVSWSVARGWPRGVDHVLLDVRRPDGLAVAGQWFADPERAERTVARTTHAILGGAHVVLHPGGADRKLPGLAPLVAAGGRLLAHRPERRAVVRTGDSYRKLVRDGRAATLARRHDQLARAVDGRFVTPIVQSVRPDGVALTEVPGRTPREVADQLDERAWAATWRRVGHGLAALRDAAAVATRLPVHDARAEVEVTLDWLERAAVHDRLPRRDVTTRLQPLVTDAAPATAVAHRDLHDGNLLVADGEVGLLDPDTLARAEPALDLANLLVHLELRVDQGRLDAGQRRVAVDELLAGYDPDPTTLQRLPAHQAAARLRLAAVHAFRPSWHALARRWFDAATR